MSKSAPQHEHVPLHPLVELLAAERSLSPAEAEGVLRGRAGADPRAAQAVREIDAGRAERDARVAADNAELAGRLGLSMDQARDLVGRLAADRELRTWLQNRVNWTLCHDRPLAHSE